VRFKVLLVLILLVAVGVVGYVLYVPASGSAPATQYLTATASVQDVIDTVVATGTVSASVTYGLGFGRDAAVVPAGASTSGATSPGPWTVTALKVDVGGRVKQGTVLATTSGAAVQLAVAAAQAALDAATAKLVKDQARPTPDDIAHAQTVLQQAQLALDSAKKSLSDSKARGIASVKGAERTLHTARASLRRDIDTGAPESTITSDQRAVSAAGVALQNAQVVADTANNQAQRAVDGATLALQSAQETFKVTTAPSSPDTIAADQATVAAAQQTLARLQGSGSGIELVAPADGIVTQVSIAVGGTAPAGDAIQMQAGPMLVTAPFSEDDVASIALGQAATVTVGAIRQDLSGKVTRISVLPTPVTGTAPAAGSTIVTYPVTLILGAPPLQLRPGMTASVSITVASAKGVLAVPVNALQGNGPNYKVRVLSADHSVTAAPVKVGLITDSLAEITGGLDAGATVVLGVASRPTGQ
jgi:multidrug efflux pump subunit AcrA (membrane-fusion protein)